MARGSDAGAAAAGDEFLISREFSATRSALFEMWMHAEHLARWWGPRGLTTPVCEVDARPGGKFRIVMRGPDGQEYPLKGEYVEIDGPARLVMSLDCSEHPESWHDLMNPGRDRARPPQLVMVQTVTFEDVGGRTRMTVRTRFPTAQMRDAALRVGMTEGWTQSLDRLGESMESDGSPTADRELRFTRVFGAPPEVVFRAWTDPEQVGRWWGPRGFTTTTHSMDLRPGGLWKHTMHGPDGVNYPNTTEYLEVKPPERLAYRNSGSKEREKEIWFEATVEFRPAPRGGTRLDLRMVFPSREMRDRVSREYGAEEGAYQTLERLEGVLAGR